MIFIKSHATKMGYRGTVKNVPICNKNDGYQIIEKGIGNLTGNMCGSGDAITKTRLMLSRIVVSKRSKTMYLVPTVNPASVVENKKEIFLPSITSKIMASIIDAICRKVAEHSIIGRDRITTLHPYRFCVSTVIGRSI